LPAKKKGSTCRESEIPFAEGKTNLVWAGIMKHINEDVPQFFNEGGWNFLMPESDAEMEEESESGSDFEASEEEVPFFFPFLLLI